MALANVRERLALHFDAEASLDSRVTKEGYEVHIRIPYRTAGPDAVPEAREAAPPRRGDRTAPDDASASRRAVRLGIAQPVPEATRG
jgi:hypothetical protein